MMVHEFLSIFLIPQPLLVEKDLVELLDPKNVSFEGFGTPRTCQRVALSSSCQQGDERWIEIKRLQHDSGDTNI